MSFRQKAIAFLNALSLDCSEASRAQSEMLDHTLPGACRVGLWLHLLLCKWCRRYGRQIRFLQATARNHAEKLSEADSRSLSDGARERIKSRLLAGK